MVTECSILLQIMNAHWEMVTSILMRWRSHRAVWNEKKRNKCFGLRNKDLGFKSANLKNLSHFGRGSFSWENASFGFPCKYMRYFVMDWCRRAQQQGGGCNPCVMLECLRKKTEQSMGAKPVSILFYGLFVSFFLQVSSLHPFHDFPSWKMATVCWS